MSIVSKWVELLALFLSSSYVAAPGLYQSVPLQKRRSLLTTREEGRTGIGIECSCS